VYMYCNAIPFVTSANSTLVLCHSGLQVTSSLTDVLAQYFIRYFLLVLSGDLDANGQAECYWPN